jgi:hypothetical protein
MRYDHFSMLPERAFSPTGKHMTLEGGGKGSAPPPPDYGPMGQASNYAADIGRDLGNRQMDIAQSQYDRNMAVAQPVIDAQLGLMRQQQTQGDDYYNYMVENQRPVERELNRQSMIDRTGEQATQRQEILDMVNANAAQDVTERGLITGGNRGIYDARRDDIEWGVGNAAADTRRGQASQANMMARQGIRYGYSPARMAQMASQIAGSNSSALAANMNAARSSGIEQQRGLMGMGYDMRNQTSANQIAGLTNARNMGIQDDSMNWGKKMDVAGLYRNLPGASQGAYGLASNAGNSAVGNSMQPGNQLLSGAAQGAGMQQTGAGQQLTGLGNVLSAQSAYNNMLAQSNSSGGGGMGALLGAGAQLGSAYLMRGSDRRLKEKITLVGKDDATGLNLYEFNYLNEPERYRGVMADEVVKVYPEAVEYSPGGYAKVNYGMLGIPMTQVGA